MTRELTHSDVSKILEIVDGAPHLNEIEFIYDGFHFHLQRGTPASLASRALPAEPPFRPLTGTKQTLDLQETALRAPVLGTFRLSSTPGDATFVKLGQRVQPDDTICIISTTKLHTAVKAGVDGVVKHVFPQDGELVEFDQLLIVIATAG